VSLDAPAADRTWRRIEEVAHLFTGPKDETWLAEMASANKHLGGRFGGQYC